MHVNAIAASAGSRGNIGKTSRKEVIIRSMRVQSEPYSQALFLSFVRDEPAGAGQDSTDLSWWFDSTHSSRTVYQKV